MLRCTLVRALASRAWRLEWASPTSEIEVPSPLKFGPALSLPSPCITLPEFTVAGERSGWEGPPRGRATVASRPRPVHVSADRGDSHLCAGRGSCPSLGRERGVRPGSRERPFPPAPAPPPSAGVHKTAQRPVHAGRRRGEGASAPSRVAWSSASSARRAMRRVEAGASRGAAWAERRAMRSMGASLAPTCPRRPGASRGTLVHW